MLSRVEQSSFTAQVSELEISPFQVPHEGGKSSIQSMSKPKGVVPLHERILSHVYYPLGRFLNWLWDKIAFRESEMEMAEKLVEDGLLGLSLLLYDRKAGEEKMKKVIETSDFLYEKMTYKWFPYTDTNRFMRQKLAAFKMGAQALLGNEEEVEKTRALMKDLGFVFKDYPTFEYLIEEALKLTTPSRGNQAKCFSINLFVRAFIWGTCSWSKSEAPTLISPSGKSEGSTPSPATEVGHIPLPFLWRVFLSAFSVPILVFNWFLSKVSLAGKEMEKAVEFLENGFLGISFLSEDRSKGHEILVETAHGLAKFDEQLKQKWFPYSKGNTFIRQKLLKFQMGLAALTGNRAQAEKCRETLLGLGIDFPNNGYEEWLENILKNTAPGKWNDAQFKFLNTIVQLVLRWS